MLKQYKLKSVPYSKFYTTHPTQPNKQEGEQLLYIFSDKTMGNEPLIMNMYERHSLLMKMISIIPLSLHWISCKKKSCKINIYIFTHARNIVITTDPFRQEPIPNFPCENGWTFSFVMSNFVNNTCRCNPWFTSSNGPWSNGTRFVVAAKKIQRNKI